MKREFFAVCLATVFFASCQKQDLSAPAAEEISLETSVGCYTRAMGSDFEDGDTFGLYILQWKGDMKPEFTEDNIYKDNMLCTKRVSGVSIPKTYYPAGKSDFYAYYPYSETGGGYYDPQKISHYLADDQSDEVYYRQSDFLRATVAAVEESSEAVHMNFSHCMSLVEVQLLPGDGMTAEDLKNARMLVLDMPTMCDVDLVSGEIEIGQWNFSDIVPFGNKVSVTDGKASLMSCILVPDILEEGEELFEITIKERTFHYIPHQEIELKPGYRYLFEITLNAASVPAKAKVTESLR